MLLKAKINSVLALTLLLVSGLLSPHVSNVLGGFSVQNKAENTEERVWIYVAQSSYLVDGILSSGKLISYFFTFD